MSSSARPQTSGDLYRKATAGGGEEAVIEEEGQQFPDDWSPDGRFLSSGCEAEGRTKNNFSMLCSGDRKVTTYPPAHQCRRIGVLSDGRWLACIGRIGRNEVYVGVYPGPGERWQVSTEGGAQPRWRRDGKELYYLSSDLRLMSVEIKSSGAALEAGVPTLLFEPHPLPTLFDAAADGQRFLVLSSGVEQSPPITLVQNWTAAPRVK
jgi:hypothetical protein